MNLQLTGHQVDITHPVDREYVISNSTDHPHFENAIDVKVTIRSRISTCDEATVHLSAGTSTSRATTPTSTPRSTGRSTSTPPDHPATKIPEGRHAPGHKPRHLSGRDRPEDRRDEQALSLLPHSTSCSNLDVGSKKRLFEQIGLRFENSRDSAAREFD